MRSSRALLVVACLASLVGCGDSAPPPRYAAAAAPSPPSAVVVSSAPPPAPMPSESATPAADVERVVIDVPAIEPAPSSPASATPPVAPPAAPLCVPTPKPLSDAAVAKLLMADSIAHYPGTCPCPYNVDRAGRSCGRRSAYSRPGGYAPLCYAGDVTSAMKRAWRGEHETQCPATK